MLAQLQQLAALTWLSALLAWLVWQGRPGHVGAAVAGAVVLIGLHAAWLTLGFGLAWWINRRDAATRPSARQWLRAWWGEARAAPLVFAWRQPFRANAVPDHLPTHAPGRAGVVLVHGYLCNRGLWNPLMCRLREQGIPCVAVNLEPVFGALEAYVPTIESAVHRMEAVTGARPLLVAHSMGGLVIRAWLRECQADERVRGVITLGTPHQGTWLARWAFTANARQMRQGSDWLARLAASEMASRRRLFLCCFSHCDHIVFPASCACLPDARVSHWPATSHVSLVHHPGVLREILHLLGPGDQGGVP